MKRKLILTFLILISAVACAFGLSACDEEGEHIHEWGEWQLTTPATCSTQGKETRICTLDSTHIEIRKTEVNPTAHDWGEWQLTTPATCSTQGEETRVCTLDSTHIETRKTEVNPTAHDWGEWQATTPATCSTQGEETRVCTLDSTHIETREKAVNPTAHKYRHIEAQAATCTSKGWNAYDECEYCGFSENKVEIDMKPHTFGNGNVCAVCGVPLSYTEKLSYKKNKDNKSYSLSGIGSAKDTDIVVPYSYEGLPVTSIADYAFPNNSNITSISIPDCVTSIGDCAIYHCVNIERVIIGDNSNLATIGECALYGCENLLSINLPDSITFIGKWAFYNCKMLENVNIPAGLTSISDCTFQNCESFTEIAIPEGVTSIGWHAFNSCISLENVKLPDSLISIQNKAFSGCLLLSSVIFSDNSQLELIGDNAFEYCYSLASIEIPSKVNYVGYRAFLACSSLESVIFKNPTSWWYVSTFTNMQNAVSVDLTDPEHNADLLYSIYRDYYWKRLY